MKKFLMLVYISLIWGCGSTPPKQADPRLSQAQQLMQQGQYERAAQLYAQLAAQPSEQQNLYRLRAAENWWRAEQRQQAQTWLAQIDPAQLGSALFDYRLLKAELAQDPQQVLHILASLPDDASPEQKKTYHRLRAEAFKQLQRQVEWVQELIAWDQWVSSEEEHLELQLQIVQALTHQNLSLAEDPLYKGWQELAAILRSFPNDPIGVIAPYREWRSLYPQYQVAAKLLLAYYQQPSQKLPQNIERIAVLLPQSGPYAQPAQIIQQGLLAAWYADKNELKPELKFYDSSDTDQVWPLLNRAADQGADLVIGPLAKPAVRQLAQSGGLPVSVLALNQVYTNNQPPNNLFQYALSPDDEVRQVAIWAESQGWQRAALLYPDSQWGRRLAKSFREAWSAQGGQLLAQSAYRTDASLSSTVKQIAAHKEHLDFILALGDLDALRQIRPLLQFHYAGQIPLLTTSKIWSGHLDRAALLDLQGVILPDIPWLLDQNSQQALSYAQLKQQMPHAFNHLVRLLPMGIDAYRLLPHLSRLAQDPWQSYAGFTGEVYMNSQRHILRRLTWIRLGNPIQVLGITPN